ncbi:MAG: aminopeptidase P N-terminal domain-containing protein, partial [Verrucomicrobiota bacterium]
MLTYLPDRRARVAAALNLGEALLLVGAGEPIPLPEGTDQTYPFRAHADYYYLATQECPGGVVAFDPRDGDRDGWVSFVPEVTEGERVWEGRTPAPGTPRAALAAWLSARAGRPVVQLGAPLPG